MKYIVDTEFIDTPEASELISLAIVREGGGNLYFEFEFPREYLTDWLNKNVVPHLSGERIHSFENAAREILAFVGGDRSPEFWCYYGAYDWYWFCRLFGGFMQMPQHWPHRFCEFALIQQGVPDVAGAGHNALNDCLSIAEAMRLHRLWE